MTRLFRPHAVKRAVTLLTCIVAVAATLVGVGASPALAATCATPGHAYVTQPGRVYFSGYDGDGRFGVPTLTTFPGDTVRLGGNGVQPRTDIQFSAVNIITGGPIDILPGIRVLTTPRAGSNCVVNEIGPYFVTAPSGSLIRIIAFYDSGNDGFYARYLDQVVNLEVR